METINELKKLEQELESQKKEGKKPKLRYICSKCDEKIEQEEIHYKCQFHGFIFCESCMLDEDEDFSINEKGEKEIRARLTNCGDVEFGLKKDCIYNKEVRV